MKILRTFKHWGGKTLVLPKILPHLPPVPEDYTYVEPFCGSGVVGLNLQPTGPVILGDADDSPVRKLLAMKTLGHEEFAHRVARHGEFIWQGATQKDLKTPGVIEGVQERWKLWKATPPTDELELQPWIVYGGLATLLGEFKKKKDGNWRGTISISRVGKKTLPTGSPKINRYLLKADITMSSYAQTLTKVQDKSKAYIYCDPPYVGTDSTGYKYGGWKLFDLEDLLMTLKPFVDAGAVVVLSHISTPEIDNSILTAFPGSSMTRIPRSNYAKNRTKRGSQLLELIAVLKN
jgi:site-specific DNA-adenine methylase